MMNQSRQSRFGSLIDHPVSARFSKARSPKNIGLTQAGEVAKLHKEGIHMHLLEIAMVADTSLVVEGNRHHSAVPTKLGPRARMMDLHPLEQERGLSLLV